MKDEILKLKAEGKTYKQIQEILGCSKGTISYHCGVGQKEKTKSRVRKKRENVLDSKLERFKAKKNCKSDFKLNNERKYFNESVRKFQKRDNNSKNRIDTSIEKTFNWKDVLNRFGENTVCYLSGEEINLNENNYHLDHIIPSSRGGDNSLNNLGILHKTVNVMKSDMTPDELLEWCVKILKYNNYKVEKIHP